MFLYCWPFVGESTVNWWIPYAKDLWYRAFVCRITMVADMLVPNRCQTTNNNEDSTVTRVSHGPYYATYISHYCHWTNWVWERSGGQQPTCWFLCYWWISLLTMIMLCDIWSLVLHGTTTGLQQHDVLIHGCMSQYQIYWLFACPIKETIINWAWQLPIKMLVLVLGCISTPGNQVNAMDACCWSSES